MELPYVSLCTPDLSHQFSYEKTVKKKDIKLTYPNWNQIRSRQIMFQQLSRISKVVKKYFTSNIQNPKITFINFYDKG